MKHMTVMIKPASSLCNLRCKYCFYADVSSLREVRSFGIMTEATAKAVIANIFSDLQPGDAVTFSFQGGEPTLAGLDFYKYFANMVDSYAVQGIRVGYTLQTNGFVIDEAWCEFLKERSFLVGLSLDGPRQYHNACRVDASGSGTFSNVMRAKKLFDHSGVEYNVLLVLTRELARHPKQVWTFLEQEQIQYAQFIPCLGPLEGADSPYALTPERYASFYTELFRLWHDSYRRGRYISIKLFDDYVNLLAFGQCNACGLLGFCHAQIIVEADGSVYPCDFYVLDEYRAGSLADTGLASVLSSPVMKQFQSRGHENLHLCGSCPYRRICGGGCKRMKDSVFYRPEDRVCGHKLFLDSAIRDLQELAFLSRTAAGKCQ